MMFLLIVTLSSMLLAAIMSLVAWRIAAEERRRSEARVAALAEEIHAPAAASVGQQQPAYLAEVGLRGEPARLAPFASPRRVARWDESIHDLPLRSERSQAPELFASAKPSGRGPGLAAVALAGALVCLVAIASVAVAGRRPAAVTSSNPSRDNQASTAAAPAPLELVALGHERDGDRLTVRGVIRNPQSGTPFDGLTTVVFVFDADGGFVTSGRGTIDAQSLRPAGESTFVVAVPGAGAVSRYRVSFRSGDRIVPHVDKREPLKQK